MSKKMRKIVATLMAVLMILAYMPAMAFAADDTATYKYTVAGTEQLVDATSLADAIAGVNNGGTIYIAGGLNNSPAAIDVSGKTFKIDVTGATLASGVAITAAEGRCLAAKDGVYTYHQAHDYHSAEAAVITESVPAENIPQSDTANVVVYCSYEEEGLLLTGVQGSLDDYDENYAYYYKYLSDYGLDVEWKVPLTHAYVSPYALAEADYVKDGKGVAVLGADGKPQFFATYKNNGILAVDDSAEPIQLVGTIKTATKTADPTTTTYGESTYVVEYKFPDDTKATETFENVKDVAPVEATKGDLKGIQLQTKNPTTGELGWSDLMDTTVVYPAALDVAANGSLTYRFVYAAVEAGEPDFYDDAATVAPKTTTTKDCGAKTYAYDAISKRYTKVNGDITTFTIALPNVSAEGTHDYATRSTWAAAFTLIDPPSHAAEGSATAKCQFCGKEWTAEDPYVIAKTADHDFVQENNADKVVTVEATCQDYGFQYKICQKPDGGWSDGEYVLDLGDSKSYTFTDDSAFTFTVDGTQVIGHPVLVAGSVQEKKPHYLVNMNVTWESELEGKNADADVYCHVTKMCQTCAGIVPIHNYYYHKLTYAEAKAADSTLPALDPGSTNTITTINELSGSETVNVYGAITAATTAGADCSKFNTITYTVLNETYAGSAITKTVTSSVYAGPHTYKNTVTFSEDGKSATVVQQCTKTGCKHLPDKDGNLDAQTKQAAVTSVDNADGSTTYTATLEGATLTDNTKTVFDLSKAVVTVNGGNDIDLNEYNWGMIPSLSDLIEVKINGAVISKDLYQFAITEPVAGRLVSGANRISITPKADTNAVGSAKGIAKCVLPGTLSVSEVTFDGKKLEGGTGSYYKSLTYDTKDHVVAVTKVLDGDYKEVSDVTIKYAVVTEADYPDEEFDSPEKWLAWIKSLNYSDSAIVKDADEYMIIAQLSKDGYTAVYQPVAYIDINRIQTGKTITTDVQVIKYGDTLTVTTGDPELDKAIGLTAEDVSKLGVGTYYLYQFVKYDSKNYEINGFGRSITIEKRNAKIVMTNTSVKYTGKAVDLTTLFTIDGLVNDDDLNVIVNTVGDVKDPVNAGKYELVATANNANYNIEEVRATLTITKLASKVKKVSPLKKSVKAGKSFKLKATKVGDGKVSFKKASGNKKITVNKAGKVTVKKGLKKGKYSVKVKVTVAASKNYKKATATKTLKITVK